MFVARELLLAIAWLVEYLLWAYMWVLIIRALISWVNPDPWNPIVRFLRAATDPFLNVFRRVLPGFLVGGSGIDFSPLVALIVIEFVRRFVVGSLNSVALRMG